MARALTIGELIAQGEERFINAGLHFGQGTTNAWDEARWLVLSALGLPIDSDAHVEGEAVSAADAPRVEAFFTRRLAREPAAYITGVAWLKGYDFEVSPQVIIPRSFIAELLIGGLTPWIADRLGVYRILDLCTGSGCLAIIAADQFANAQVIATDISAPALQVAEKNVKRHGLSTRIRLLQSDMWADLSAQTDGPFDLIICNPPYVPTERKAHLPREFDCEPAGALYASLDGMEFVREVLARASDYLLPEGLLVVEIGGQQEACERLLNAEFPGLAPVYVESDEQSGNVFIIDRHALCQYPWRPRP